MPFLSSRMVSDKYRLGGTRRSSCLVTSLRNAAILMNWHRNKPVTVPCNKTRHSRAWVGWFGGVPCGGGTVYNRSTWQEQSAFHNTVASMIHSLNHNCPRCYRHDRCLLCSLMANYNSDIGYASDWKSQHKHVCSERDSKQVLVR